MKHEDKTKEQLISQLEQLRQRFADLDAAASSRKQTEEELHLFKAIVESSSEAIAISDPNGRLVYINSAHEKLFGRSLSEARQLNYRDYYPSESVAILDRDVAPALARGESWEGELEVYDASGRRFPLWERADTVRDAEGRMLYGFGLMHDISERNQALELLRIQSDLAIALGSTTKLTETLDLVLEASFQIEGIDCGGIYLVDESTGALDLVAHKGLPFQFVESGRHYDPDTPQAQLVKRGNPIYGLFSEISASTEEVHQNEGLQALAVIPVKHEGEVVAVLNLSSHTQDEIPIGARKALEAIAAQIGGVVARVRAEEALRRIQRALQSLFNSVDDFLFILDSKGRIFKVNPNVA